MTVIDPDTKAGWVPEADEIDEEEEMPLSLRLSIADTLTLGNATCGFMAVYFTTTGILIPDLMGSQESGMARNSAHSRRSAVCSGLRADDASRSRSAMERFGGGACDVSGVMRAAPTHVSSSSART